MVFLIMLVGSTSAQVSGGGVYPDITLKLQKNSVDIRVSPGETGSGAITASISNIGKVQETVKIEVFCAQGLSYAAPGTVTLPSGTQGSDYPIPITITAPERTKKQAIQCTVRAQVVRAGGVSYPGTPHESYFTVNILMFARLRVESQKPFQQIQPNKEFFLTYKLFNDGNNMDEFDIRVTNIKTLEEQRWSMALSSNVYRVPRDDYETVRVSVRSPKPPYFGYFNEYQPVTLQASSINGAQLGVPYTKDQTTVFYVWGIYLPGFEGAFAAMALAGTGLVLRPRRRAAE